MTKESIFGLTTSQVTVRDTQLGSIVMFLSANPSVIVPMAESAKITGVRQLSQTAIDALFAKAMRSGSNYDQLFSFVRIPSGQTAPEAITFRHLTMDTKQLAPVYPSVAAATAHQSFANKIILNVTQLTRASGDIADISTFQGYVVRDLLSRTYFESDRAWLTPSLAQQVCRIYSMSLAADVAQIFDLDRMEQFSVQAIFCFYYLSKFMPVRDAEAMFISQNRDFGIPHLDTVRDVVGHIKDVMGDRLSSMGLYDACSIVAGIGIPRLSKFEYKTLIMRMRSIGEDVHTSAMALEYPPYYLYLILQVASGRKIGFNHRIRSMGAKPIVDRIANDLERTHSFLP